MKPKRAVMACTPGTGVFLASNANLVPSALIRNIEHNCVVHQRVIILNVEIADTPRQDPVRRLRIEEPVPSVHYITARFGSFGRRHGSALPRPMTPFCAIATISETSGRAAFINTV